MNVLITSAGRRTGLVKAFKAAVGASGGCVLTADIDGLAPTHFIGDGGILVPPIADEGYVPALLEIVAEHRIGLLVPTIDTELSDLANASKLFKDAGCLVAVSTPQLVDAAGDKLLSVQVWKNAGIKYPATWSSSHLPAKLPDVLACKPRSGSASEGFVRCSREDLRRVLQRDPELIVQEYVEGPEITVDALFDMKGNILHCVPRRRIRTLAGESVEGVTLAPEPLTDWLLHVLGFLGSFGARGPVTVQAIWSAPEPTLIEVNPRFGGGDRWRLKLAANTLRGWWLSPLEEVWIQVSLSTRLGCI